MQHTLIFVFFGLIFLALGVQSGPPFQLGSLSGPGEDDVDLDYIPNSGIGTFASVRLPRNVYPLHYDLEIRPIINLPLDDPTQFTAPGNVVIRLRCDNQTNSITLHSEDIDIQHETLKVTNAQSGASIAVTGHSNDSSMSTYTINLGANLIPQIEYDLTISFTAKVGDRLEGLYRSSYKKDDGSDVWLATTQFQKLGARMAFPCWDEPNFRSTFNITVGRSVEHNSLSNSPRVSTTPIPGMSGWFWDTFDKTVNMPTYLIAIIVSDFVNVTAPADLSNYAINTWGPPTMVDSKSGEFSAFAAAKIVSFLETYYDSPYQFNKLDSVAIPDFAAGAMENWALNTYRTVLMLWYEGESTQFEQWRQAAVIGHEIVHHWFGDLVTCDWWNDLWLNEGFARYMQFIAANAAIPEHKVLNRYTIDVLQLAMDFDAGPNTEPVHSPVTDQVVDQASRVIYEKAAALIRMMQGFLTEDTLIKGLRNYLDKYAYANTVQDQLFEELEAQAEADGTSWAFPVKELMDSWTLKSGFPLVTLRRAGENVVYISQEAFGAASSPNELWYVPIAYATKANPDFSETNWRPKFWIDKYTLITSKIFTDNTNEWIILNPDARSYFRVVYDNHFFSLIVAQLEEDNTVISLSSRSQLIDDYFKSAFAGYVNIEDALTVTRYLDTERENTVWTTVFNNLRQPSRLLQDTTADAKFKNYILSKVTPALDSIGWEQLPADDPVTIILRTQLLDWACAMGSEKCDEVTNSYITALAAGTSIPADIQPMIYCNAVSLGSATLPSNFDIRAHVEESYAQATRVERHTVFINALACESSGNIVGLLDLAVSPTSPFTTTHAIQLIQRISENPENRATVLNYLTTNLQTIIQRRGESAISSIISSMAAYTSNSAIVQSINAFITAALTSITNGAVRTSLENSRTTLTSNGQWVTNYAARIEAWLP